MYSIKHCKWQSHRYAIILYLSSNLSYNCLHLRRFTFSIYFFLFLHPFFTHTQAIFSSGFRVDVLLPHCQGELTAGDRCRWQDRPPIQSVKGTDGWKGRSGKLKTKTTIKCMTLKMAVHCKEFSWCQKFGCFHVHAGEYFFKIFIKRYSEVKMYFLRSSVLILTASNQFHCKVRHWN